MTGKRIRKLNKRSRSATKCAVAILAKGRRWMHKKVYFMILNTDNIEYLFSRLAQLNLYKQKCNVSLPLA